MSSLVPPGRLVRLGVVADARINAAAVSRLAVLAERAGLDALWLLALDGEALPERHVLSTLSAAGAATRALRLGAHLPTVPDTVPESLIGRTEVTVPPAALRPAPNGLARVWVTATDAGDGPPGCPAVVPAATLGGASSDRRPLAVVMGCSIGRTSAEAQARATQDPLVRQRISTHDGLYGTLQECQHRILGLARAGVVDVRCILPSTADVHDVIAQLSAVAAGTLASLDIPGRSADPSPPVGWGGRRSGPRVAPCDRRRVSPGAGGGDPG